MGRQDKEIRKESGLGADESKKDDNPIKHVWHPEPNHKGNAPPGLQIEDKGTGIISHHEVLARLEAYDTDRGELVFFDFTF